MALPFPDNGFDAAVMALVIFFVPEPAKGLAEMVRVVRPGGMVAAYAWDMLGGGFPFAPLQAEVRALGITPPQPPSAAVSRMDALRDLWADAGLESVETREITVQRGACRPECSKGRLGLQTRTRRRRWPVPLLQLSKVTRRPPPRHSRARGNPGLAALN
jgi:SAM-dependent methyltransferase